MRQEVLLGALMMCSDNHPSRFPRQVEIAPVTGKQPLAEASSNRRALQLHKAMRRSARRLAQPSDGEGT